MRTCSPPIAALAVFLALPAAAQSISFPEMPSMPTVSITAPSSASSEKRQSRETESGASAALATSAAISAKDLAELSNLGALDTISSLLSGSSGTSGTSAYLSTLYGSGTSSGTTNLLLEQILEELSALKEKTEQSQALAASQSETVAQEGSTEPEPGEPQLPVTQEAQRVSQPRILRFSVNGYNVLSTCTRVYISVPEDDGTFLVTGDRKYTSDGKARTETFHILFRAEGKKNGLAAYSTATAVSQDYTNEYSFLYQLAARQGLSATRMGNLVTLRTAEPSWRLELLIDLGTQGTR